MTAWTAGLALGMFAGSSILSALAYYETRAGVVIDASRWRRYVVVYGAIAAIVALVTVARL